MTNRDRVKLLAGPYTPPKLHKGQRAFCLLRDCDVVITGWSDARISWPRCRAIGARGGSGLLVDDELARAIRTESAVALKYWWGIGTHGVWNWRKVLGVSKVNNPGTNRLVVVAAKKGAKAIQAREWTVEEREASRRRSIQLNLGQYKKLCNQAEWWSKQELALLGKMPDKEVAKRIGRTTFPTARIDSFGDAEQQLSSQLPRLSCGA